MGLSYRPVAVDLLAPFRVAPTASAILLDVDGTLAPIVAHPDLSRVPPATLDVLKRLADRFALVACVSGRSAHDAKRLVPVEGVHFVGNHGLETLEGDILRYAAGVDTWLPIVNSTARAIEPIAATLGTWVEDKGATFSVHLREAPDPDAARSVLVARAVPLIIAAGLGWRMGRMTLEVRPPINHDKGTAIAALLASHPSVRHSLYAGDDSTDLDAFEVVDVSIAVRSDEAPAELTEAAQIVVDGPFGLIGVLNSLAESA